MYFIGRREDKNKYDYVNDMCIVHSRNEVALHDKNEQHDQYLFTSAAVTFQLIFESCNWNIEFKLKWWRILLCCSFEYATMLANRKDYKNAIEYRLLPFYYKNKPTLYYSVG